MDPNSKIYNKGTNRLRIGRCSLPRQIYHVTASTLDRIPYFVDYKSARSIVESFQREERIGHANTLAFVVMPDHFHWLFALGDSCALSTTVGNVKSLSARKVNRLLGFSAAVWQPGYHDRAIRRDEDIAAVARYIVTNPLRARLVERIGDYPYWDAVWL